MKILAIIPARGGSKGIYKKNIVCLNGKPLISYSIEAAIKSSFITDIIVSSDDDEILKTSIYLGANVIKRPADISKDETPTEPVLYHVLSEQKKIKKTYDLFILLQPTSPLRNHIDIDNAFRLFIKKNVNSLISVISFGYKPYKCFKIDKKGFLKGLVNDQLPFSRRQDLEMTYLPNGAIYITKPELFIESGSLYNHPCIPFKMENEKSIDIDTNEDLNRVSKLLLKKK